MTPRARRWQPTRRSPRSVQPSRPQGARASRCRSAGRSPAARCGGRPRRRCSRAGRWCRRCRPSTARRWRRASRWAGPRGAGGAPAGAATASARQRSNPATPARAAPTPLPSPRPPPPRPGSQGALDVTGEARALMGLADGRVARGLLSERTPALRRAWEEMHAAVSKKSPVARGVELSEEQVGGGRRQGPNAQGPAVSRSTRDAWQTWLAGEQLAAGQTSGAQRPLTSGAPPPPGAARSCWRRCWRTRRRRAPRAGACRRGALRCAGRTAFGEADWAGRGRLRCQPAQGSDFEPFGWRAVSRPHLTLTTALPPPKRSRYACRRACCSARAPATRTPWRTRARWCSTRGSRAGGPCCTRQSRPPTAHRACGWRARCCSRTARRRSCRAQVRGAAGDGGAGVRRGRLPLGCTPSVSPLQLAGPHPLPADHPQTRPQQTAAAAAAAAVAAAGTPTTARCCSSGTPPSPPRRTRRWSISRARCGGGVEC
jgi:hypothetical protein